MARLDPKPAAEFPELSDFFATVTAQGGWVPDMYLTMARNAPILRAFAELGRAVMGPGTLGTDMKALVAFVASNTAGCRFCAAHTSKQAFDAQVPLAKIALAFEHEDRPEFTPAERAALRFARDAALHPPEVEAAHFEALRTHFNEAQIVELLSVCCLFAFTNRWHDTVKTDLEPGYETFIRECLAPHGWHLAST